MSHNITWSTLDDDTSALKIANQTSGVESDQWVIIVDTVILTLTIIGALGIMASMIYLEFKGRAATTRTRLVQSLVLSDLVIGITGLIGSTLELAGNPLLPGTPTCDGLGVMLVAVLWTEHLWTLTLAAATFMILIYPLHSFTLLLERKWYYLWFLVWVIAFAVAVMGYELYGYFPNGGVCFYGSNSGLYGELIQFLPRAVVFICITFFYARLFVFLRRPDKIRSPYSDSPTSTSYDDGRQQTSFLRSRYRHRLSEIFRGRRSSGRSPVSPTTIQPSMFSSPRSPHISGPDDTRRDSKTGKMDDIPPWERVELPSFQVDGQRFGGASANVVQRDNVWHDWKGFGGKKRPSTASSFSNTPGIPLASPRGSGSLASGKDFPGFKIDRPSLPPHLESVVGTPHMESVPLDMPEALSPKMGYSEAETQGRRRSAELSGSASSSREDADFIKVSGKSSSANGSPLTSSTSSTRIAETPRELNQFDPEIRRESAVSQAADSRRGSSIIPPHKKEFSMAIIDDYDTERGGDDSGDDDLDLMRVLQQTAPPDNFNDGYQVRSGSEQYDYAPESMSSYLNRKTALLMLWFPLGYVLLFSVSLVRIIYDFAAPDNPSVVLRALSRWFIFAQGVLDALIYGLVEWHTKRVVRKRVKRGVLSPRGSRGGSNNGGSGSAMLSFGGGRRTQPLDGSHQQIASQLGQTVSFAEREDPRLIHQRLAPNTAGGPRKSSLANSLPLSINSDTK